MKGMIRKMLVAVIALGLMGGAAVWYPRWGKSQTVSFRTARVTQGDLLVSIGATGTVEPEEVVDVGAQVAGQILSFGKDLAGKTVDYGSLVEEGTVLARIDESLYAAQAAEVAAQLQSAKAGLQRANADLDQIKARFRQAERDWDRAQKLGPSEALAQTTYDAFRGVFETAKANVFVGEAAILQARAGIAQAEAVVRRAGRNLAYCTITSPVKGVVIDRRVNIGQTVVASLNAPSLFLIAKDLTRMQVWVAVNEADIGRIRPGQPVTFTVDAFPGETFRGQVGKVRLNASMTQNVVTYTVEIVTDNSSGRLLPYLTANVQFELDRRNGVLLAPNGALRWMPSVELVAPQFREAFEKRTAGKERNGAGRPETAEPSRKPAGRGVLWVAEGTHVRPMAVRVGLTDGIHTEVEGEGLSPEMEIITGLLNSAVAQSDATNPFAPKLPQRGGGGRPR